MSNTQAMFLFWNDLHFTWLDYPVVASHGVAAILVVDDLHPVRVSRGPGAESDARLILEVLNALKIFFFFLVEAYTI